MTWSNRAMSLAPEPLPNDVATLRALLAQACAERDAERAEKAQLASQNDRLRHLIRQLQRLQFGRRSEKLDPDQSILRWRISSRPSPKPRLSRRRPIRQSSVPAPRRVGPAAARCPSTC